MLNRRVPSTPSSSLPSLLPIGQAKRSSGSEAAIYTSSLRRHLLPPEARLRSRLCDFCGNEAELTKLNTSRPVRAESQLDLSGLLLCRWSKTSTQARLFEFLCASAPLRRHRTRLVKPKSAPKSTPQLPCRSSSSSSQPLVPPKRKAACHCPPSPSPPPTIITTAEG